MIPRALKLGLCLSLALPVIACGHNAARGAEQLRAAYADALRKDDPDAAYALMSEQAQAKIDPKAFRKRWDAQPEERKAQLASLEALDARLRSPTMSGTTTHPGGHVLRWTEIEGEWLVTQGLAGTPDNSTPASTIRAFIRALRSVDYSALSTLLDPELSAQIRDDWTARAERIEAALADPEQLDLSMDLSRAVLRYGQTEQITLEQGATGWRIIEFD